MEWGTILEPYVVIPQKMFRHLLQYRMIPTTVVKLQWGTSSLLHLLLHNETGYFTQ